MKVLLLTHHFYPTKGGIESFSLGLAKELLANGIDCSVACLDKDPITNQRLAPLESVSGIIVKRHKFLDLGFYKIAFGLLKEIKKADLVHVQNIGFLSDFALLTKFFHKKPVVISTHGGISHTKERQFFKRVYSRWLDFLLKKADYLIADSQQDFALFEKKIGRIKLIGNGVELENFLAVKRRPVKDSFIFVGRIAKNKRINNLLEVFALVLKKRPFSSLRIIGKDFDCLLYGLKQKAIDLGISNRVFFEQEASDEQLLSFMKESEFFVSASETEGFGISAIEAMAAGCIPILNDIEAFRNFVVDGKQGAITGFSDLKAASSRITALMDLSDEQKISLSKEARLAAEKFSWKKAVKPMISIYEQVIG